MTLLVAAFLPFLVAGPALAQGSVKVATFDPQKLLTNSKLGQTLQESLNQFRISKEGEIKKSADDLEKRVGQYKAGLDTMSQTKRDEVEGDLTTRRRDLERMTHDADGELTRRRQKAVHDLEGEVASIIDDYGKKNGYTLILQRDLCAYAVDSIDVSGDLVKLLDAKRSK